MHWRMAERPSRKQKQHKRRLKCKRIIKMIWDQVLKMEDRQRRNYISVIRVPEEGLQISGTELISTYINTTK